jgi:hypothetical protein
MMPLLHIEDDQYDSCPDADCGCHDDELTWRDWTGLISVLLLIAGLIIPWTTSVEDIEFFGDAIFGLGLALIALVMGHRHYRRLASSVVTGAD